MVAVSINRFTVNLRPWICRYTRIGCTLAYSTQQNAYAPWRTRRSIRILAYIYQDPFYMNPFTRVQWRILCGRVCERRSLKNIIIFVKFASLVMNDDLAYTMYENDEITRRAAYADLLLSKLKHSIKPVIVALACLLNWTQSAHERLSRGFARPSDPARPEQRSHAQDFAKIQINHWS